MSKRIGYYDDGFEPDDQSNGLESEVEDTKKTEFLLCKYNVNRYENGELKEDEKYVVFYNNGGGKGYPGEHSPILALRGNLKNKHHNIKEMKHNKEYICVYDISAEALDDLVNHARAREKEIKVRELEEPLTMDNLRETMSCVFEMLGIDNDNKTQDCLIEKLSSNIGIIGNKLAILRDENSTYSVFMTGGSIKTLKRFKNLKDVKKCELHTSPNVGVDIFGMHGIRPKHISLLQRTYNCTFSCNLSKTEALEEMYRYIGRSVFLKPVSSERLKGNINNINKSMSLEPVGQDELELILAEGYRGVENIVPREEVISHLGFLKNNKVGLFKYDSSGPESKYAALLLEGDLYNQYQYCVTSKDVYGENVESAALRKIVLCVRGINDEGVRMLGDHCDFVCGTNLDDTIRKALEFAKSIKNRKGNKKCNLERISKFFEGLKDFENISPVAQEELEVIFKGNKRKERESANPEMEGSERKGLKLTLRISQKEKREEREEREENTNPELEAKQPERKKQRTDSLPASEITADAEAEPKQEGSKEDETAAYPALTILDGDDSSLSDLEEGEMMYPDQVDIDEIIITTKKTPKKTDGFVERLKQEGKAIRL
ncbi:hypothetical protein N9W34_00935 [Rickettsiales bacterium]|nr:hypothetical protein [Rickettsiales bacterium]